VLRTSNLQTMLHHCPRLQNRQCGQGQRSDEALRENFRAMAVIARRFIRRYRSRAETVIAVLQGTTSAKGALS